VLNGTVWRNGSRKSAVSSQQGLLVIFDGSADDYE
jgi:hypothetical protein